MKEGTVGITKKGLLYKQLFVEMLPNFIQFPPLLKKRENSNIRKLRKIFLAPGENRVLVRMLLPLSYWNSNGEHCSGDLLEIRPSTSVQTQDCIFILKKKDNSNTRKLGKLFRAPGKNRTHDPPCSSSDALTTSVIHVMRTLDPVPLVSM